VASSTWTKASAPTWAAPPFPSHAYTLLPLPPPVDQLSAARFPTQQSRTAEYWKPAGRQWAKDKGARILNARTLPDLVPETRAQVRFVLMNSFSTSDDTKAHLRKKHAELVDEPDSELVQNKSPKIDAGSLAPAQYPDHPDMEWCASSRSSSIGIGDDRGVHQQKSNSRSCMFGWMHSKAPA